ncbi:uncharacterized protein GGS25DRAFT_501215 [Hypoxylon fragiforme]|uniref:uncharacterized protein n=1 Tax=Hypoxylon fragiforme TaxID=63214 RepID=UPI0020C6FB05|nr:uncharacterized protein GGS25DRAFT_501215 [Hypoxylon fragiforme]KAI2606412.1 hypothetical protein GGS25DRAFT_501215 [Hypoxylon fragiforme]
METAYFGPLRLTRAVLPYMRKRRYGVIVNISSVAAMEAHDALGAYAGAKAALDGMTRVLSKEIAPFGIRTLTVSPGTFNTNIGNNTVVGKNPLPDDYKGSVTDQTMQVIAGRMFQAKGDPEKAMKAVYEVVVGEGIGKGHETEPLLPLGQETVALAKTAQDHIAHALEVFGDVCNSVTLDKK